MYVKMTNKLMLKKISISILSAILGLVLSTMILYRHYQRNDFINIVIIIFLYYTLIFGIGIYLFNYLANMFKILKMISSFLSSKIGLTSILIIAIFLIVLPLGKYLIDDLVLALTLITCFFVSLLCYIYITKATQ